MKRQLRLRAAWRFALVVSVCSVGAYAQTTWYVNDDAPGDPGPGSPAVSDPLEDGSAAHPFDAIQEAIDASTTGDTVIIRDGTYTGEGNRDIDYGGRDIVVQSEHGAASCIVDCQGMWEDPHRAFRFQSGETNAAVLEGVTIRNGFAGRIGSAHSDSGGGVYVEDASPTIRDCVLESNRAGSGIGGAEIDFGGNGVALCGENTALVLSGCVISNNYSGATGPSEGYGAGLYFKDSTPLILHCELSGNRTDDGSPGTGPGEDGQPGPSGGAAYFRHCTSVEIRNCRIIGNRTGNGGSGFPNQGHTGDGGNGAGIAAVDQTHLVIRDSLIADNHAGDSPDQLFDGPPGNGGDGGGLFALAGTVELINVQILNNSTGEGGRCYVYPRSGSGGLGAGVYSSADLVMQNCSVRGNRTGQGAAGYAGQCHS